MNTKQLLLESISDPGEQLGGATRNFMERRFDADLGDIRIHRSAASDSVSRASGSLAYAVDNHIGFKTGFNESCGELYLYVLAHELVHVLQKVTKESPSARGANPVGGGSLSRPPITA
jgi:hypothetical protein